MTADLGKHEQGGSREGSLATAPGVELSYDRLGPMDGSPVVYAHGLSLAREAEDRDDWLLTDFQPLVESGLGLVRYDARGHGRSTGTREPETYTWSALADDLLAVIDHTVGPGRAVDAIGASMGCGTLLNAAVAAPERFRRLVLVIPPTAWATRAAQGDYYRSNADLVEAKGLEAYLELSRRAAEAGLLPGIFQQVLEAGGALPERPAIPEGLLPSVFRGAALSDLPDPEALRGLDHPALILAWAGDPGHPVSTAERLAELLPNSELRVAEDLAAVRGWGAQEAAFLSG